MNNISNISFDSVAKKPVCIITAIYAIIKTASYALIGTDYTLSRAVLGVIMVALMVLLTQNKTLPRRLLSVLVPLVLFACEMTYVVFIIPGDRLTYLFLIGVPLVSLLYIDIRGLIIVMATMAVITAVIVFGLNIYVMGPDFTLQDEFFNYLTMIVMYALFYLLARYSITALINAQKSAEEATLSKSNFIVTISHEIRTPLNAILGLSQVQLEKENLPEDYSRDMEKIYVSGKNMLAIINDLLDMSKIEIGKLVANPVTYYSPSLINDTVQLNIVRIGSKKIQFFLDIQEDFPMELYGDEIRVKQILNNLLSNAIKYTESGFIKFSISHTLKDETLHVTFVVEDSGQGIKEEDLANLFSEYTRFNIKTNYGTEGTGIGLTITKRLTELMDGTIKAESKFGKGSKFTVIIKQKQSGNKTIGSEIANSLRTFTFSNIKTSSLKAQATDLDISNKSILIVDDVEINYYVANEMLHFYGIEADYASNGLKAICAIEKGIKYDLIFMDHMMPEMDGIETTKKLRELNYDGTIVALTANAIVGNAEMFLENGFDDFMSKPIDAGRLNLLLTKWLQK